MSIAASTAGAETAGTFAVRDGTKIAWQMRGNAASGRRIALMHSLAMTGAFWRPVAERLAESAEVLSFDCRGHGQSDKPAGPYTVELFADDLADLMSGIGWNDAVVAGASMGGCVALAFAIRHPARTRGLGLIDTTAWYGADAPANWAARAAQAREKGLASLVGFQVTRWFGDAFREANPELVAECVEIFRSNDIEAYVATCAMLGACDLRAGRAALTLPTRIVVGEEDYATPVAMAEASHAAIAGSSLLVVPGARHLTPLEVPEVIAAELSTLIEEAR